MGAMTPDPAPRSSAAHTRTSAIVALAGFVAYLSVPPGIRLPVFAIWLVAAVAVVVFAIRGIHDRSGSTAALSVAAASAVGMVGSILYLNALADRSVPVLAVGAIVMLVSVNGLFAAILLLRRSSLFRRISR